MNVEGQCDIEMGTVQGKQEACVEVRKLFLLYMLSLNFLFFEVTIRNSFVSLYKTSLSGLPLACSRTLSSKKVSLA